MRALVVYESLFGNTHEIADAIAAGIRDADPGAEVQVVRAADADGVHARDAELVVVGGPTHMWRTASPRSRRMGLDGGTRTKGRTGPPAAVEPGATGPGVREWLGSLPLAPAGSRAAAFDTRLGSRLSGGAARSIGRSLRRHGYVLVVPPMGFVVRGGEGPLAVGEADRARTWASSLVPVTAR